MRVESEQFSDFAVDNSLEEYFVRYSLLEGYFSNVVAGFIEPFHSFKERAILFMAES